MLRAPPPGDGDTVILDFFRGDMVIFAEKFRWYGDIGLPGDTWYSPKYEVILWYQAKKLVISWYCHDYGDDMVIQLVNVCNYIHLWYFDIAEIFWWYGDIGRNFWWYSDIETPPGGAPFNNNNDHHNAYEPLIDDSLKYSNNHRHRYCYYIRSYNS